MRKVLLGTVASVAFVAGMSFAVPASAQVVTPGVAAQLSVSNANDQVIKVQRRHRRHWRRHWRRHHWRHRRWDDDWGPGLALGLGAGLLFDGLAANAQAQSAIDWCDARYRSYDRMSQTYLGYDGYRHPCP